MERRGYPDPVCRSEIPISRLWETVGCGGPFPDTVLCKDKSSVSSFFDYIRSCGDWKNS